jgi:hypothetical protein
VSTVLHVVLSWLGVQWRQLLSAVDVVDTSSSTFSLTASSTTFLSTFPLYSVMTIATGVAVFLIIHHRLERLQQDLLFYSARQRDYIYNAELMYQQTWLGIVQLCRAVAKGWFVPFVIVMVCRWCGGSQILSLVMAASYLLVWMIVVSQTAINIDEEGRRERGEIGGGGGGGDRYEPPQRRPARLPATSYASTLEKEQDSAPPDKLFLPSDCVICVDDLLPDGDAEGKTAATEAAAEQSTIAAGTPQLLAMLTASVRDCDNHTVTAERIQALRAASIQILNCGHCYHRQCFVQYLQAMPTSCKCLMCRQPLTYTSGALENIFL